MAEHQAMNVQCFVKKDFQSVFTGKNDPKLLYVSDIRPDTSAHPRVMHAHEDFVELILICSGSSEYLIHDKKYKVQQGDLLIYNPGVVHDEISGSDNLVGSYCIAVGNLHMPELKEYALIPQDAGFVFPTGEHFEPLKTLFEMMFRSLSSGEINAEAFCHSLMHAVLVNALTVVGVKASNNEETEVEEPSVLGQRIKEYIDKNYTEPITLQSMGEALNISPYYLSHVFKEMSGYSPMQYLLQPPHWRGTDASHFHGFGRSQRLPAWWARTRRAILICSFPKMSACRRRNTGKIILSRHGSRKRSAERRKKNRKSSRRRAEKSALRLFSCARKTGNRRILEKAVLCMTRGLAKGNSKNLKVCAKGGGARCKNTARI